MSSHDQSCRFFLRSCALLAVLPVATTFAEVITVDDDGKADFDSIQAAVDYASDGDEILVAPGVYTSDHPAHVVDMLGKAITLRASAGPEVTIIDGEGVRRGIICINDETVDTFPTLIEGFTIQRGFGVAYDFDGDGEITWLERSGGGIFIEGSINLSIAECVFDKNSGDYGESGVFSNASNPTLTNCTFTESTMLNVYGSPTLADCTFTGPVGGSAGLTNAFNSSALITRCTFSGFATGIQTYEGGVELSDCIITENSSLGDGGGMYNTSSNVTLTHCTFAGNSAGRDGGGMYNVDSDVTLTHCTFTGNSATGTYGDGGGMYNDQGNQTLRDCAFTSNNSELHGGGVYFEYSSPMISDCIFTSNATGHGGGIYLEHSSPTLIGCTFTENIADPPSQNFGGGGMTAEHCEMHLTDCIFDGNISEPSEIPNSRPSYGGGLLLVESGASLDNCQFRNNSADTGGGILSHRNGEPSDLILKSCTFANNSARVGGGGAITLYGAGPPELTDTTLCGNNLDQIFPFDWNDNGGNCISLLCHDTDDDGRPDCHENGIDDFLSVPGEYPTIESAIDAAAEGALIEIAAGTYAPIITLDTLAKAITLRGTIDSEGNPSTIIDGQESMRVLQCVSGEGSDTVFENLIITGGYTPGDSNNHELSSSNKGAGMFNRGSSPTLINCTFTDNSANSGGGMFNLEGSPTLTDCMFTDNSAGTGAGMFNEYLSNPTFENCTFSGNSAEGAGGGMYNYYATTPILINCSLTDNSASVGGAMYNWSSSNPTMTNSVLCGNTPNQLYGPWTNNGGNAIATSCDCPADINGDGDVNGADLTDVLGFWGTNEPVVDLNNDGVVDGADLTIILGAWGACP